ncbi:MAG: hypothetical protein KKE12_16485 [Proteobacteria bacterium]|nr:hypothetical protein [Pseudomonadota bacterium]
MKKIFFSIFFMLFFILMPGMGEAFVPQAPHLLHLVVEKIKQPVGIEAFQIKKIFNYQDTQKTYVELKEKLIYVYPNRLRAEIISDTITSFSVESDFRFVKVKDGVIVSHDKPLVDLYTDILFYRDYESLLNQIRAAGIDTDKVTFKRYNDTICYVIGRSLAKGKPFAGLWIEKDTVFPIRYVVEKNGMVVEFLYHNWQRFSKTWYPMQVSIFLDNQLFAMVDMKSLDLKSGFSASLFDIEHIDRLYPRNDPGSLDENSKQVDELGKRLEDFKKLYE